MSTSPAFNIQVGRFVIERDEGAELRYGSAGVRVTELPDPDLAAIFDDERPHTQPLVDAGFAFTGEMVGEIIVGLCERLVKVQPNGEGIARYVRRQRAAGRAPQPWQVNGCSIDEYARRRWDTGRAMQVEVPLGQGAFR